jgi:diguanylate cyclase (GGDEF)-like protein
MIGTHRDLTDLIELQKGLQVSNDRLTKLIANHSDGILVEDEDRKILIANTKFCELFNIPVEPAYLTGQDCSNAAETSKDLFIDPESFVEEVNTTLLDGKTKIGVELVMQNGTILERDYIPVYSDQTYMGHMWIYKDITERKKYHEMMVHKAFHDFLTGLPNRDFFLQKVNESIKSAKKDSKAFLFYMDLDGFKLVNDNFGHDTGDELLQEVANRFNHAIRENDLVARMGGDEFALWIQSAPDRQTIIRIAERILSIISAEYNIHEHTLKIGLSAGISVFPDDGADSEILIKKADQALYAVKTAGKNHFLFFEEMTD